MDLSDALKGISLSGDPRLLVGFNTSDDAAVYQLTDEIAFITTVDFITPPVDDPYWFGQIAAANSLSDIYAMGGEPLTALNLVMFPSLVLDKGVLREILRGGNDKVIEAHASMVGGHSVDDVEPKYGLAVTGVVHPKKILTNSGAKAGDALILTKPLGTGVLFNACRSKKLRYKDLETILPQIAYLNNKALESSANFDVHACTDITGFGIIGHLLEVAKGSGVQMNLFHKKLPIYPFALEMYRKGVSTGSNKSNKRFSEGYTKFGGPLSREEEELLYDPQTSGGLLLAVPQSQAQRLLAVLRDEGMETAAHIGEVVERGEPKILVT